MSLNKKIQPTVASNARWLAFSQAGKAILQLIGVIILSRILSPSDYGVMALAMVVTNLGGLLRDMGTGPAVIRAKDLTDDFINSVFWFNLLSGFFVALIICIFAPTISYYFKSPELEFVLYGLSITFPIMSLGAAHQSLLERSSNFKIIARSDLVSYLAGIIFAIVGASFGMGVYSLVLQALIHSSLSSFQMYVASGWQPTFVFYFKEIKKIFGFSSNLTLSNFVSYLTRNSDSVIAGKHLSPMDLGQYSLAFKVMLYPLQNISQVATKALYPILSTYQDNKEFLQVNYLNSLRVVALLVAPLMAVFMALSDRLVPLVFGSKWSGLDESIFWLAPVGYIQSILISAPPVFMAKGKTGLLLIINSIFFLVHLIAWYFGVKNGLQGLIEYYLIATVICSIPYLWITAVLLEISFLKIINSILPSIACGASVYALAVIVGRLFDKLYISPPLVFLSIIVVVFAYLFLYMRVFMPDYYKSVTQYMRRSRK